MNLLPIYVTASSAGGGGGGDPATTSSVATTTTSAGGEGGAGGVACTCDDPRLSCCGAACVNLASDPHNCGTCGVTCDEDQACIQGECKDPCDEDFGCEEGICCGEACCIGGTICCDYGTSAEVPLLRCQEPENGTCPLACSGCGT